MFVYSSGMTSSENSLSLNALGTQKGGSGREDRRERGLGNSFWKMTSLPDAFSFISLHPLGCVLVVPFSES